jgi:glycosyltransferase involved in cell wall biosynthesis
VRRLKVLLSAYACEPGEGSEPGVGWNTAVELARHHNVWVLTRRNNRPVIESELAIRPVPNLHFEYFDLPAWASWWKRGQRGVQLYYYLWQLGAWSTARGLHASERFDMVQHVTFVRYWTPSLLAFLPVPLIWGPVGGGESMPTTFRNALGSQGRKFEARRDLARRVAECDPLVHMTARRSSLVLATTPGTAERVRRLGARHVEVRGESGLSSAEIEHLQGLTSPETGPLRLISLGRLLHWKGFHLGLQALAHAAVPGAEYWIVGDGPERQRLEVLAAELGVADCVRFWGKLPRSEALARLGESSILLHPSLHDSGGWVCLEAMAAGKPVVCLDLGGPATQVTEDTGVKVPARDPEQVVNDLAVVLERLAGDPELRTRLGRAGRERVVQHFEWGKRAQSLDALYWQVVGGRRSVARGLAPGRDQDAPS